MLGFVESYDLHRLPEAFREARSDCLPIAALAHLDKQVDVAVGACVPPRLGAEEHCEQDPWLSTKGLA